MKVKQITVHAGRTFNHPYESYSNLRPAVTMVADLEDGDDAEKAVRELQAQAETLVEDHKQHMLRSLEELHYAEERQSEIARLDSLIKTSQTRLENLRNFKPHEQIEFAGEPPRCPGCDHILHSPDNCDHCSWPEQVDNECPI